MRIRKVDVDSKCPDSLTLASVQLKASSVCVCGGGVSLPLSRSAPDGVRTLQKLLGVLLSTREG